MSNASPPKLPIGPSTEVFLSANAATERSAISGQAMALIISLGMMLLIACYLAIKGWLMYAIQQEKIRAHTELELEKHRWDARSRDRERNLGPGMTVPRAGPLAAIHAMGKLGAGHRAVRVDDEPSDRSALLGFQPTPFKPFNADSFVVHPDEVSR